jgi:tellurite resistance protein
MPIEPSDEEERYFQAVEAETRKKLRDSLDRNAKALEEHGKIAESVGTADHGVAERIKALGFDGESAAVFDLLPLVHVAWADGAVQKGERAAILKILKARGIESGTAPFQTIESLLEERPSDAFMRQSMEILREVVGTTGNRASEIVDLCIEVAAASGGFLGVGRKIGDEEKELIAQVSLELGATATEKVKNDLG